MPPPVFWVHMFTSPFPLPTPTPSQSRKHDLGSRGWQGCLAYRWLLAQSSGGLQLLSKGTAPQSRLVTRRLLVRFPVEASLSKTLNPLIAPDVQCAINVKCKMCIHCKSHICKSLWINASAKWLNVNVKYEGFLRIASAWPFSRFLVSNLAGRNVIWWSFKASDCCSLPSGGLSMSQLRSHNRMSSDEV